MLSEVRLVNGSTMKCDINPKTMETHWVHVASMVQDNSSDIWMQNDLTTSQGQSYKLATSVPNERNLSLPSWERGFEYDPLALALGIPSAMITVCFALLAITYCCHYKIPVKENQSNPNPSHDVPAHSNDESSTHDYASIEELASHHYAEIDLGNIAHQDPHFQAIAALGEVVNDVQVEGEVIGLGGINNGEPANNIIYVDNPSTVYVSRL